MSRIHRIAVTALWAVGVSSYARGETMPQDATQVSWLAPGAGVAPAAPAAPAPAAPAPAPPAPDPIAPLPPATVVAPTAPSVPGPSGSSSAASPPSGVTPTVAAADPSSPTTPTSEPAPPEPTIAPTVTGGPALASGTSIASIQARESGGLFGTARLKKFEGTNVDLSTYVGSGSFYTSGYRDPYTSVAIYFRPTYQLGTRYKLSLNARLLFETELSSPDTSNGRRFYPYDPWVNLTALNLHTFERAKIRIGGVVRTIWPLSWESRFEHLLFGVGAGLNANRTFEWGDVGDEKRKWKLLLTYGFIGYKYLNTSDFRGNGPGDTTGCRAPGSSSTGGSPGNGGEPGASDADRCGGPANTNFAILNMAIASLARGPWSFAATLLITNSFKHAFPEDALTSATGVPLGRSDTTWGIASLTYQWRPRVGFSAGVSSIQPALDSRYRTPRFPFFDLSGGLNANNFTQLFLSVNGSL